MLWQCWRGYVQGSGSISKYRKCSYIMKCDYIIWLPFSLVETLVKIYDYFQKVSNFFQYFVFFLNNELSMWYYLYIFVKLSKGATTFVNRVKHVAVFLVLWETWPKKEIGSSFIEHAVLFLNVVTKCDSYLCSWDLCQTDCGNL